MEKLKDITLAMLSQMDTYLSKLANETYTEPIKILSDASIGEHTRHILDGFLCLKSQLNTGTVCYDKRARNPKIANDIAYAKKQLEAIKYFVKQLGENEACNFSVEYADKIITTPSSLRRELIHNIEHLIHHLAIIKIALKYIEVDFEIPESFGVAPSTLKYRNSISTN